MENLQTIHNFSDIESLSLKREQVLILSLETGAHASLMYEVVENYQQENPKDFSLIRLTGTMAQKIQSDLSILKLPALIILYKGNIQAIFQGLVARHEIQNVLSKVN